MTAMCAMCLEHLHAAQEADASKSEGKAGYGFWVQHFNIDKLITARSRFILERTNSRKAGQSDAGLILLHLNLCAVIIFLHEIAIAKAMRDSLPDALSVESRNRCRAAAIEIATILRQTEHLDALNVSTLPFLPPKNQNQHSI